MYALGEIIGYNWNRICILLSIRYFSCEKKKLELTKKNNSEKNLHTSNKLYNVIQLIFKL